MAAFPRRHCWPCSAGSKFPCFKKVLAIFAVRVYNNPCTRPFDGKRVPRAFFSESCRMVQGSRQEEGFRSRKGAGEESAGCAPYRAAKRPI